MSQTISVSTQMDEQGFRDFAVFDLLHHNKAWKRPAAFCAIMLVFSGICMSQIGKREGAGLLTAVLAIVAFGLPLCYFGFYFRDLAKQIKKMKLPRPFYRVELSDAEIEIWMAGQQDKAKPTARVSWDSVYCAYRTPSAVYLYFQKTQAYLLNESTEAVWKLLGEKLPAEKLHDCRKA